MEEIAQKFENFIDNDTPLDDAELMNELFGDEFQEEPENAADEAQEAPERTIKIVNTVTGEDVVQKPKRVLLKLDLEKLFSDRGLSAIPSHIKPLKFRGKGHELEDISRICRAYEHWAHRLYPKMTFKDVIEKVEHLGLKNRRKCFNKKMEIYEEHRRMAVITGNTGEEEGDVDNESWPVPDVGESTLFGTPGDTPSSPPPEERTQEVAPAPTTPTLTPEQIERMRVNRLKALERRKLRESGVALQSATLDISPLARTDPSPETTAPAATTTVGSSPEVEAPTAKRFKGSESSPEVEPMDHSLEHSEL